MALMTNYAIGNFTSVILTLRRGVTLYNISKFSVETYFDLILQYEVCIGKFLKTIFETFEFFNETAARLGILPLCRLLVCQESTTASVGFGLY
jgi:hypothetical protein